MAQGSVQPPVIMRRGGEEWLGPDAGGVAGESGQVFAGLLARS
jgi:hypothetical protein